MQLKIDSQRQSNIWATVVPGMNTAETPDSMEIINLVRSGLPGSTLAKVAEAYQIPKADMYNLLHISAKTGQRIATKKLDKDKSDHLIQMVKVFSRTNSVFKDSDKAMSWLKSPCYALGDQIPVQLLDTTEGMELVMNTLGRIEYGVFA